jgi:hypothetical protein
MSAVGPLTSGKAAIAGRMAHRYFVSSGMRGKWMLPGLDKLERSFTAAGGSAKEYFLAGAPSEGTYIRHRNSIVRSIRSLASTLDRCRISFQFRASGALISKRRGMMPRNPRRGIKVNNAIVELDSAPLTVAANTWYRARFEAVGTQLRVYINDSLILEATDASHPSGRYGPVMYRAGVEYDDILAVQP